MFSARTMRCSIAMALTALTAVAQDDKEADRRAELREAEARVSFAREADGRITVSPNPAIGESEPGLDFTDLRSCARTVAHSECAWWSLLLAGGSDLSAAVDAVRYFEMFGKAAPESLLDRLRDPTEVDADRIELSAFERLLVVRALADLGFKPALGRLERIAADDRLDPTLRGAAREAIDLLRGSPHAPTTPPPALADLASIVALAPSQHDVLLVVDRWRMPQDRGLLARLRRDELAHFEAQMLAVAGGIRSEWCAGANAITDQRGLCAYELARCFGNQRIDRLVLALRLGPSLAIADGSWLCCEGAFDLARIESGARAWRQSPFVVPGEIELKVSSDEDGLRIEVGASAVVRVTASRMLVSVPGGVDEPIGLESARALLGRMPDAPLRGSVRKLPGVQQISDAGFGFWPASSSADTATIDITLADGLDPSACLKALRMWLLNACRGAFRDLAHVDHLQPSERGFRITIPGEALDFAEMRKRASGW
ncbi:MAG: hypothetical protein U1F36_09650 [Planctomycetota bacterium]